MNELLLAIFKDIDSHIYKIVDRRVSEILANHATLNTINEEFEDKMRQIAKDEVYMHEAKQTHHEHSDIAEIAKEAVDTYDFSDILNEHDFSDTIADLVHSELNETLEDAIADKLQQTLCNIKFVAINTKEM